MDTQAVTDAIAELAPMLQADGADLTLVDADPATARIEVQLHVEDASCMECVLPGPLLKEVISDAISRRMPTEFELVLRDPRPDGEHGSNGH
jgi:Fe-S cluster biogenesis protein NfuA